MLRAILTLTLALIWAPAAWSQNAAVDTAVEIHGSRYRCITSELLPCDSEYGFQPMDAPDVVAAVRATYHGFEDEPFAGVAVDWLADGRVRVTSAITGRDETSVRTTFLRARTMSRLRSRTDALFDALNQVPNPDTDRRCKSSVHVYLRVRSDGRETAVERGVCLVPVGGGDSAAVVSLDLLAAALQDCNLRGKLFRDGIAAIEACHRFEGPRRSN